MGRRRTARTISRRTLGTLTALAVAALIVVLIASEVNHAVSKLGLPLTNADVIRKQAAEKHLDPALIAGGHLRRDEIRPAPVLGRRRGPDADPPGNGLLHRAPVGRQPLHGQRPGDAEHQRGLRQLLPALPARPLRRQRDARRGGLQRRPGERRQLGRAGAREGRAADGRRDPVPGDARVRASACWPPSRTTARPTRASSGCGRRSLR